MDTYISRRDLDRFVREGLSFDTCDEWNVDAIVDDMIESWPNLIGHHRDVLDFNVDMDVPLQLSRWIDDYICGTSSALEEYRCMRSGGVYWAIVAAHQSSPVQMAVAEFAEATRTSVESWNLQPEDCVAVLPGGTVNALLVGDNGRLQITDITPTDSALRARCAELTQGLRDDHPLPADDS
jgi:hypothetical protein